MYAHMSRDGNARWAQARGMPVTKGHEQVGCCQPHERKKRKNCKASESTPTSIEDKEELWLKEP
eukprot:scaffold114168_cov17-Tisochrysis_lutea.AAC.3